jgi:monofunctional chorismate mutase
MNYEEEIESLRDEINRLNEEIVDRLAERVEVAQRIGKIKAKHDKPIVDRMREKKVIEQVTNLAAEEGIDPEGTARVFREIIRLCTKAEGEG